MLTFFIADMMIYHFSGHFTGESGLASFSLVSSLQLLQNRTFKALKETQNTDLNQEYSVTHENQWITTSLRLKKCYRAKCFISNSARIDNWYPHEDMPRQ